MLRSCVRLGRWRDRSAIVDSIQRLKASRRGKLTEIPIPQLAKPAAPPVPVENTSLTDRIRQKLSTLLNDDEPVLRLFTQEEAAPTITFLKTPLDELAAETGPERLSKDEIYLLQKLDEAMFVLHNSKMLAIRELFYRLGEFKSRPYLLRHLTPYAWELLWTLETQPGRSIRSRMVGDLMIQAGVEMTEDQELSYIEALHFTGDRDRAVERWENLSDRCSSPDVWTVGVMMFSTAKKPVQAEQVVQKMEGALGHTEHQLYIPILLAYNATFESEQAWKTYEKMRRLARKNGEKVQIKHFDGIAMSFLACGQPAMGLKVYKHMIFYAHSTHELMDTDIYQNLQPAILAAQDQVEGPEMLDELSLDSLRNLPPKVADMYFFGGWMRNLMRMGRVDLASYLISEVMPGWGYSPSSMHANWVVQGFLEQNKVEWAEKFADAMIGARLQQLERKKQDDDPRTPSSPPSANEAETSPSKHEVNLTPIDATQLEEPRPKPPTDRSTPFPPATIETFSLFINHFARRRQMDQIVNLCSWMSKCQITANTFIINHLLRALFRTNQMSKLAHTFTEMLNSHIEPDVETYLVMWIAAYTSFKSPRRTDRSFLQPRYLFKQTIERLSMQIQGMELAKMVLVWINIVQSFMEAKDVAGGLVALHVGARLWGLPIDDTVTRIIAVGVIRARPKPEEGAPRFAPISVEQSVQNLRKLGEALDAQRGRKGVPGRKARKARKAPEAKLQHGDGSLENLTLLMMHELRDAGLTPDVIKMAADEMGVGGHRALEGLPC